jgi:deazaflavin-dependent oxidoreductase (nitroreductase family)
MMVAEATIWSHDVTDTETRTTTPASSPDWQTAQREMIRQIRDEGHPVSGWKAGEPVLLLTTVGARTGEERMCPLAYSRDGEAYIVTASKGGAPTHPAWYHNLLAHPGATVEVERERFAVRATIANGAERQRLWEQHIVVNPGIGEYPKKTDRVIPVVILERVPAAD